MQIEQIRQRLDRAGQYAEEARHAAKATSVPAELRRCVESLHYLASDARHNPLMDHELYRDTVLQLEELADEAMRGCREAGGGLDPQVLPAVQRAHAELTRMKEEVLAHA
jgi:hypothetical protein